MASILPKNMEKLKKNLKEIVPNLWQPEKEGDEIAGILTRKEKKEEGHIFYIEVEGKEYKIFSTAILEDRLSQVDIGSFVHIVYEGEKDIGNKKKLKLFKVFAGSPLVSEEPKVKEEVL